MAFDKSKSSGDKGKASGGPPSKKPASPKGPPSPGGPPPDPMAADPMATGIGVQPPMPGTGIDPYAALMGQVSQAAPMGMPMGGGAGGMGGGMPHAPLQAGPPVDPLQQALMSGADPMAMPPDIGQTWADPEGEQQQLSLNQLLTMLALMQGGVSATGGPGGRTGSATAGIIPAGMRGGF